MRVAQQQSEHLVEQCIQFKHSNKIKRNTNYHHFKLYKIAIKYHYQILKKQKQKKMHMKEKQSNWKTAIFVLKTVSSK